MNLLRSGSIVGSWEGPCVKSDILNAGGRANLKFNSNDFKKEVLLFGNDKCDSMNISVLSSGEFSIGSGEGYADKVYPVDYKFTKITVTPLNQDGLDLLETGALCGVKGWVLNEEKDLTDVSGKLGCALTDMRTTEFDVVRVEGNSLKTGKLGMFSAPAKPEDRPKDVADEVYTRK